MDAHLPTPLPGTPCPPPLQIGYTVYLATEPQGDLIPKWQGPYTVILMTPTVAKLWGIPSWVHLNRLKELLWILLLTTLNRFLLQVHDFKIHQVKAATNHSRNWMNWISLRFHPFIVQFLRDIWISPLMGRTTEKINTSTTDFWLQGYFSDFTVDEITFFCLYTLPCFQ